ncbi:MAG: ABC transporter substrate-binding protein [Candidatus Dadabacteria bacterium]|nr:ABC transporter substrate-binding protein [Candidatus Dadabacteria bacterium]NIQ13784.1 ABC transporter substrate-binding protein [Candidatus Dadabacteria bacterium]
MYNKVPMRICSLLPSTTEIICSLGLGDKLVGVTHECDYPPEVSEKKRVVISNISTQTNNSKEIDDFVKKNFSEGKSTYLIETDKLKEARPTLILTQGLCEVCAVSKNNVLDAVEVLDYQPQVLSLEPNNIKEIMESIIQISEVTKTQDRAKELVDEMKLKIEQIKKKVSHESDRPRVFCLEWLDPPFVAGHWVPEMVEIAGGNHSLNKVGEYSREVTWEEILDFAPNYMLVMPCGFDNERTLNEIDLVTNLSQWQQIPAVKKGQAYIVNANSYFSRPSPRITQGIEILAGIIHPEIFKKEFPGDSVINIRNYYHLQSFLG